MAFSTHGFCLSSHTHQPGILSNPLPSLGLSFLVCKTGITSSFSEILSGKCPAECLPKAGTKRKVSTPTVPDATPCSRTGKKKSSKSVRGEWVTGLGVRAHCAVGDVRSPRLPCWKWSGCTRRALRSIWSSLQVPSFPKLVLRVLVPFPHPSSLLRFPAPLSQTELPCSLLETQATVPGAVLQVVCSLRGGFWSAELGHLCCEPPSLRKPTLRSSAFDPLSPPRAHTRTCRDTEIHTDMQTHRCTQTHVKTHTACLTLLSPRLTQAHRCTDTGPRCLPTLGPRLLPSGSTPALCLWSKGR